MHDTTMEERVRAALRAEADDLPFTLTADELQWRLAERRRQRFTQRSVLTAAAAIALAVVAGGAIYLSNRGDGPPVGSSPSPSPSATGEASPPPVSASPFTLPSLGAIDGTVLLDVTHIPPGGPSFASPLTGGGVLVPEVIGNVPATDFYDVLLVCVGPGTFSYLIDPESGGTGAGNLPCDGVIEQGTFSAGGPGGPVEVTVDARVAWRLVVYVQAPVAGIPEPPRIEPVEFFELVGSPAALGPDDAATIPVTLPPGTDDYFVVVSCVGDGRVEVATPGRPLRFECDPAPGGIFRESLVPPATDSFDVSVRTIGQVRATVQVEAYDLQSNPDAVFIPPAAVVRSGPDEAVQAALGCGISFELATGETAVDECGPAYPVMPPDRTLRVAPNADLTLTLADGWTITAIDGRLAATDEIITSVETVQFAPLEGCCDTGDAQPSLAAFRAPGERGDWTIRLDLSASKDGSRYSIPYYVRVIVE